LKIPLHGYSSPIVWGTKVFITGANENNRELYCIDISTGKMLWTAQAKDIQGSPGKSPETTDDTGLSAPTQQQMEPMFMLFLETEISLPWIWMAKWSGQKTLECQSTITDIPPP
jgi:outer membrane protein assembly factor BamB